MQKMLKQRMATINVVSSDSTKTLDSKI